MIYHLEPPLFDSGFFGWSNGRRILWPETAELYCNKLIALLCHRKSRMRWIAADQLGKLKIQRAVEPLVTALSDPHWLVRLHSAKALGRIGHPQAIPPLINALNDDQPSVRRRVAQALGHFASDEKAFQQFISTRPQNHLPPSRQADKVLESFSTYEDLFNALVSALKDPDGKVRTAAVQSLSRMDTLDVVAFLAKAICDPDGNVSWRAVAGIRQWGTAAIEPLLTLLTEENPDTLYRVIKTLGYIGDSRVVEALQPFLRHPNEKVRGRAGYALRQITHKMKFGTLPFEQH